MADITQTAALLVRSGSGYLASPVLAQVHWQAEGRPLPAAKATVAGESALLVVPAEIPSSGDVGRLWLPGPSSPSWRKQHAGH
jgi:hypothetical protein